MDPNRRKKASLAINAILRGLEFDQLVFHYDETASPDVMPAGRRAGVASESRAELIAAAPSLLLELPPLARTTTAA